MLALMRLNGQRLLKEKHQLNSARAQAVQARDPNIALQSSASGNLVDAENASPTDARKSLIASADTFSASGVSVGSPAIAQASSPPPADFTRLPTDVTPIRLGDTRFLLSPETRFRVLTKLPKALWFNITAEMSQRLETNVFFTHGHYRSDYVFRTLPNITLGYNVLPHTSVYCNYFVLKDVFAKYPALTFPTTQSLAMGLRQDCPIGARSDLLLDVQARELWQTSHLRQSDLIPAATYTFMPRPQMVLFASTLLQMRSGEFFEGATRELDPFYTVGTSLRRGLWVFSATDTLVTNFRDPPFHHSVPKHGNDAMIADFEVNRPVSRAFPALVWFIRAEPIFNWASGKQPGLSGFDFRLYSGLRITVSKPSYAAQVSKLRQQLRQSQ